MDHTEINYFADVVLPVPIPQFFTYRLPREIAQEVKVGARMVVEFGKSRVLTALVLRLHNSPPEKYQAKYIEELLDNTPVVTPTQLWLLQWVAEYYMCTVGEVLNMALPSGLKISTQSKIQYNPDFNHHELLEELEKSFLEILIKEDSLSYEEVGRLIGEKDLTKFIKSLVSKHAIVLFEEVSERYKPKMVKMLKLNPEFESDESVLLLIESLKKAKKQQEVILKYLSLVPIDSLGETNKIGVEKSKITSPEISDSAIQTLLSKGILEQFEVKVSRLAGKQEATELEILLSEAQQRASDELLASLADKEVTLFHGITGSGKTEVYIDIIKKALEGGSQVLFLLPEIALTTQMVRRLAKIFGDKMGVYHSKFSDNERVEVWRGVLEGKFQFVLGVRSAIFLPFKDLGLVIVDEEHEASYKQYEPAPRYHARDVAIMLAQKMGAKVILGSATPSLETYYQALQNKFGLVKLLERFGDAQLPEIQLVNLRVERENKTMTKEFSSVLLEGIKTSFAEKMQSIIFLNRRGYAPYLNCQECNWIPRCNQCSVTLTHHLYDKNMVCHYCGYKEEAPKVCPICSSPKIKSMGFGTERIEDDLREILPEATILRMDLDTTRTKNAYENIIENFESGEVDILVGTQMVSKGLDFERVNLVGVFNADKMIHFPDFRAAERAFQLITQVSGRAGRRNEPGRVMIQTNNPQNRILQFILANDYLGFYESEIIEREAFNYPPFSRVIEITIKDSNQILAHQASEKLAASLKNFLGEYRVRGPEKALVERVRNKYLFLLWLKLEKDKLNIKATKEYLQKEIVNLITEKKFKSVQVIVNVDAV